MDELNQEANTNQRKWLLPVSAIILVALLAAAAFIGARYLGRPAEITSEHTIDFVPAEEIPQSEPELNGIISSVEGDSLFVQEFSANDALGLEAGGSGGVVVYELDASQVEDHGNLSVDVELPDFLGADGPITEVVITHDTLIYQDVTNNTIFFESDSGSNLPEIPDTIEQQVEIGSVDEIGKNSTITVWGERRADRVIAEVILYQPAFAGFIEGSP